MSGGSPPVGRPAAEPGAGPDRDGPADAEAGASAEGEALASGGTAAANGPRTGEAVPASGKFAGAASARSGLRASEFVPRGEQSADDSGYLIQLDRARPRREAVEAPGLPARLGAEGRAALEVWGVTRLGMIVLAWMAAWLFASGNAAPGPWLARWDRWDAGIFVGIARDGYFGPGTDPTHVAFFPGFPVAMWAVHLVARNWTAAGLAVSVVAGAVAAAALGKLAADEPGTATNRAGSQGAANATLFFTLAPAGVFLAAGYSESLFAAFAFPAWLAARRDRWVLAVVLAAGASTVRVNGLFLAGAIALEFLLAGAERRQWRQLPLLLIPVLPVFGYAFYLHRNTGDWLAWQHAQAVGWFRTFQDPKSAWDQTWRAAFGQTQEDHTAWVFQLELVAVVVGAALTLFLLACRRWPEALYVGLSLLALGTTTWFMSVPRAMLLWWPLWTLLGAWSVRRPLVRTLYICCVAPIMVGVALLFLSGQWAG